MQYCSSCIMKNKVIILTGDIRSGKTSFLMQFCRQQPHVAGLLTPIVHAKRVFYDVRNAAYFNMESDGAEESLLVGKYSFSAAAFSKANSILLFEGAQKDIQFLLVDEVGPLEINFQQGFYRTLTTLLAIPFSYTVVIVLRPSLLEKAVACFGLHEAEIFTLAKMKHHFEK